LNWAFELLGLRPDADATDVKRAYARLLRTTRPDEDAEAFQRLHAAYKTALAQANARSVPATHPITETKTTPLPDVTPDQTHTASPEQTLTLTKITTVPAINLDALVNEVIHAAVQASDGPDLSDWLNSRQEFWSIQLKQQCGHMVLSRLFQQPQAISTECMDALLHFFDLDHVLSGVNPIALQALRSKQRTRWEILPSNHRELARRMQLKWGHQPDIKTLGKNIALLQKPRTWLRTVRVTFQFGRIAELGRLVHTLLGQSGIDELPPSIDREHAFFWLRAAAPGLSMTRQRFIIGLLRAAFAALACALGLLCILIADSMGGPPSEAEWVSAVSTSASAGAIVFVLWPLFACVAWFDQWQGKPESDSSRWPWLRRLAIPALCFLGLIVYESGDTLVAAWVTALLFICAVRKFRQRTPATSTLSARLKRAIPILAWVGGISASVLSHLSGAGFPFVPIMAIATFGVSAADLWRYREHLHPKLARS
jgi:hypothetical protein